MPLNSKTYLGDGVYVQDGAFAGCHVLTTENGIEVTNTVVLEPEVMTALIRHVLPGALYQELIRLQQRRA